MKREPTKSEQSHWSLFNILLKITGYCFMINGGILTVYFSTILLDNKATIKVNGEPTTSIVVKIICVGLPLIVGIAGFYFVKAKSWYPQVVRDWFEERNRKK